MAEIVGGRGPEKGPHVSLDRLSTLPSSLLASALIEALKSATPELKTKIIEMLSQAGNPALAGQLKSTQMFSERETHRSYRFKLSIPLEPSVVDYIRGRHSNWDEASEIIISLRDKFKCDLTKKVPKDILATLQTDTCKGAELPVCTPADTNGANPAVTAALLGVEAVFQARERGIYLKSHKTGTFSLHSEPLSKKSERVYKAATQKGLSEGTAILLKALTSGGVKFQGDSPGVFSISEDGSLVAS